MLQRPLGLLHGAHVDVAQDGAGLGQRVGPDARPALLVGSVTGIVHLEPGDLAAQQPPESVRDLGREVGVGVAGTGADVEVADPDTGARRVATVAGGEVPPGLIDGDDHADAVHRAGRGLHRIEQAQGQALVAVRAVFSAAPLGREQHGGRHASGVLHTLHQVVLGAFGQRPQGQIPVLPTGHHHHRDVGPGDQDGAQRLQPLRVGQRQIGDGDVERFGQQGDGVGECRGHRHHRVGYLVGEDVQQQIGVGAGILDQQDPQRAGVGGSRTEAPGHRVERPGHRIGRR